MSKITSASDIKKLGTIMSVWAHPDDESFLAAGVLTAAVHNGQKTICVTATRGEEGNQNPQKWPAENLSQIRTAELERALKILGIHEHHWLDYPDGRCSEVPLKDAAKKLQALINRTKPDTILTFGPDGWTGHEDHKSMYRWVHAATKDRDIAIYSVVHTPRHYAKYFKPVDDALDIFFNIDKPPLLKPGKCDIYFELPDEICRIKCDALAAAPSQTEALFKHFDREFVRKAFAIECFVQAS
ncbi:MAG TPA: PIG-L family deacetylase [Patescibacteria group bacterium]|nr:PIG-L family deacetylase [Patescibacteria group bacterium]